MARLIIRYPNNVVREVEFEGPRYRIGTAPDNDLVLEHDQVSPHQAEIESVAGGYTLVDVAGNGTTLVNGKNVERNPITYGDRISFGPVVGLFYPPQKKAMGDRAKILLYLAAGGAVILLSIVLIFFFTTRRISTEVTERIGEPATGETVPGGPAPREQVPREQEDEERTQEPVAPGAAGGFISGMHELFGGEQQEPELPEPDPEIIRKRRAVAVPRGLARLFFRKIPVPVEASDREVGEPEERMEEGAPPEEVPPAEAPPEEVPPAEAPPAGPDQEQGIIGRLIGGIRGLFGGNREDGLREVEEQATPAGQAPPETQTPAAPDRQAPGTPALPDRGPAAQERQTVPPAEEPGREQAVRDFERVTDPLAAIRRADIPEVSDLEFVEEPIYPEDRELSRETLLGQVELSEVQNLNLDVLWTYPPAFQERVPIMRTGAVGRIDEDRRPDLTMGNGNNQLIVLRGGEGAELFVQDLGKPFLEPSVVNLDGGRTREIVIVFEDGSVSLFERDLTVKWSHTGDRFIATPLLVDVNGDGTRDLVLPTFDMELVALDGTTGFELWRFYDAASEILHPAAALDMNKDGVQDVLFVTRGGSLHALDGKTGWGLWKREVFGKPVGPPVVADLNGDGEREVLCLTDTGVLSAHGSGGRLLFAWETGQRYRAPASAGDVDGDGNMEIVLADEEGTLRVLDARTRREKWSFQSGEGVSIGRVALADCDGRRGLEVVFSTVSGAVFVLEGRSGVVLGAFNCGGYTFTSPLLADLNGDRINEILVSSYGGEVFALQLADAQKPLFRLRRTAWASLHHDHFNSGTSRRYIPFLGKR